MNRELERLQAEEKPKVRDFEYENFPELAMNPNYWKAGSSAEKGLNLERKFGRLLQDAGFEIQFTPTSGDNGIDIRARKKSQRVAIQCKNYAGKVDAADIREFAGAMKFEREKSPNTVGWMVAPNGFSKQTFSKFHRSGDIELWEFTDIQELVVETYQKASDVADEELGVFEQ